MQMCVCLGSWREGRIMQSTSKELVLIFGEGFIIYFKRKKKKGGFRGRVDECVDGGILIGVILT